LSLPISLFSSISTPLPQPKQKLYSQFISLLIVMPQLLHADLIVEVSTVFPLSVRRALLASDKLRPLSLSLSPPRKARWISDSDAFQVRQSFQYGLHNEDLCFGKKRGTDRACHQLTMINVFTRLFGLAELELRRG
jgi:hypothetical protein